MIDARPRPESLRSAGTPPEIDDDPQQPNPVITTGELISLDGFGAGPGRPVELGAD